MTDLSKEALDALTTWLEASDDMSRDEFFAKAHEKCLEATDAITALREKLAMYEGISGHPISATGAVDELADKIEALQREANSQEARATAAEAKLAACKGMWGQYSPSYGPFIDQAKAEWEKGRKWVFDTSHDVSEVLSDGTRRHVGTFKHASDAEEAERAVNGVRSGSLTLEEARHERDVAVARAALDEAALLAHRGVTDGGMAKSMALFLDADEWAHYKDACLAYRDKILSLDPAQIVKDMEGKE